MAEPLILRSATCTHPYLQVRFEWCGDRYGHLVELCEPKTSRVLVRSREGTGEDDWPLSPPLQQLHLERRDDRTDVALLVGMAGRNHWSMSVELIANGQAMVFDVACKRSSNESLLLTSYESATKDDAASRLVDDHTLQVGPARIELISIPGFSDGHLHFENSRLIILPGASELQTMRWKYRIAI